VTLRHDLPRVVDEDGQQFILNRREVHVVPINDDLSPCQIDVQRARGEAGGCGRMRRANRMPERDAEPCLQFPNAKGFGQVIIRTGI
jgi:hypothetical protein